MPARLQGRLRQAATRTNVVIVTTGLPPVEKVIQATEANRHFSRILREVAEGDTFTVTSHGRPIARIVPPRRRAARRPSSAYSNIFAASRPSRSAHSSVRNSTTVSCAGHQRRGLPQALMPTMNRRDDKLHRSSLLSLRHSFIVPAQVLGELFNVLTRKVRLGGHAAARVEGVAGHVHCHADDRGSAVPRDGCCRRPQSRHLGCNHPCRRRRSRLPHAPVRGHAGRLHLGRRDDRQPVRTPTPQIARRPAWLIATSAPPPPARAARKSPASVPPRSP